MVSRSAMFQETYVFAAATQVVSRSLLPKCIMAQGEPARQRICN